MPMRKLAFTLFVLLLLLGAGVLFILKVKRLLPPSKMPPATQVLMDNLGQSDRDLLQSLSLVTNRATGACSTGLLTSAGVIVTDAHTAEGARVQDLAVLSSKGEPVPLKGFEQDRGLDVAFLYPAQKQGGGLELGQGGDFGPGDQVYTWGFSDQFDRPQPLLCMGFVAGFHLAPGESEKGSATRLVLGGPFTTGFGGSPVFRWRDNQMVGLLVMRASSNGPIAEAVPVQMLKARLEAVE
jgi:hypothetical protein